MTTTAPTLLEALRACLEATDPQPLNPSLTILQDVVSYDRMVDGQHQPYLLATMADGSQFKLMVIQTKAAEVNLEDLDDHPHFPDL